MRVCQTCGAANPDARDFCACGEYLRWEETGSHPEPVPQRGVADTLVRATPRGVAAVIDRPAAPGPRTAEGRAARHAVDARQRTRVLALVRNQSGIVDNYDLRIDGLPREWWSIPSGTLYLAPFGSDGSYEQEVEIELHPPRSAEADARMWQLKVVADSRASGAVAEVAPLLLRIRPFAETHDGRTSAAPCGPPPRHLSRDAHQPSQRAGTGDARGRGPGRRAAVRFEPSALEVRPGAA